MNDSTKTQIHHSLKEATVKILAEGKFQGSGFFVTPTGYLVTAYHCVAKPAMLNAFGKPMPQALYQTLEVETFSKERYLAELDKDKSLPDLDIAVLKVPHSPKQYLPVGRLSKQMIGDEVVGCGCPGGDKPGMDEIATYHGIFTRILTDDKEFIEIQGAIQGGGQSGGAIYHYGSQCVIAITEGFRKDAHLLNVAIAVRLDKLLEKWNVSTNPYRGLAAFRQADAQVFFGRGKEIEKLLELVQGLQRPPCPPVHREGGGGVDIQQRRFTALVGVSGSGKSSVVFAGLVPQLEESYWQVIECRPESHPFNRLAAALVKLLTSDKLEQAIKLKTLEEELPTGEKITLSHVVQIWHEKSQKRLLLIIDQFEELYTANSTVVQQQFLACLLKLVNSDVPAVLLVTLRADFMSQALMYPEFAQTLNGNTRFISSVSRAELEEVIEKPAAQVRLGLETGLTERILEDLGTAEGRLPLLQFALTSLFEKQRLGSLTHEAYTEIGGVEQALVRYADQVLAKFSATEHDQLRQIFVQLVHPGQGTEDTRLVVTYSQLADKWAMVKRLADSRLVVTGQNKETQEETVEVIHEALIRQWPRLQEWMKADRTFRVWQEAFQADLKRWQAMQQPRAELLRGAKLAQAEEMLNARQAELIEVERAFIQASRQEQRRQKRVWQGVMGLVVGLLVVAVVTGMLGWWQWGEAKKQEAVAKQQTVVAEKNAKEATEQAKIAFAGKLGTQAMLAAQSPSFANGDSEQALLLAVQALQLHNNSNTQGSLSNVLQDIAQIQKIFHGYEHSVTSVAVSPDENLLISGSADKTLILWDVATGRPIGQPWQGHKESVGSVAFSPDGKHVISGSIDRTLILWDAITGLAIGQPWQGHKSWVRSVAFSPDGKHVISGSLDKTLILWDVATGLAIGQPWQGHKDDVRSVAFSPNGKHVISGSQDTTLILWDVATGQPIGQPWLGHENDVDSVAFSYDEKYVISGGGSIVVGANRSKDNTLRLWDVATGQPIGQPWLGHKKEVNSVAFSPDGTHVISGSNDNTLILWDVATGQPVGQPWQGHQGLVESVAFTADGKHIISGSLDNSLILWRILGDVATRLHIGQLWLEPKIGVVVTNSNSMLSVAFSTDGKLVAGGNEFEIILWDVATGRPIGQPWQGHQGWVRSVAFSPDGKHVISGSYDNTLILWDVATGQAIGQRWLGHNRGVESVAFSPDGRHVISGSIDSTLILWNAVTGQPIGQPWQGHKKEVNSVAFSPDGKHVISGSDDNTLILWDVATGQAIGQPWLGHNRGVNSVAFSPDGKHVISGSDDNTLILWNAVAGQPVGQSWQGHQGRVQSVAFSPDGKHVISGSHDTTLILWDVVTGRLIGRPWWWYGGTSVHSVAFSHDGKYVISGSGEVGGIVALWQIDPYDWVKIACRKVNRNFTKAEWIRFIGDVLPYQKTCEEFPLEEE